VLTLLLVSLLLLILAQAAAARPKPPRWQVPVSFMEAALCVHSGWHYEAARTWPERRALGRRYGHGPDYWQGKVAFYRTVDVPDSIRGGSGEGAWDNVNGLYGGGLQFMLGTWNRAAGLARGKLRYARSRADISRMSWAEQVYGAFMIVTQDGGSWREWPLTSRACNLR